jgi:hypothetical protein
MTEPEFVEKCIDSLQESVKVAKDKFERLVRSGAIDLESSDMIDVKASVCAFLLDEAEQRKPFGTCHVRRFNRSVKNNRCFN